MKAERRNAIYCNKCSKFGYESEMKANHALTSCMAGDNRSEIGVYNKGYDGKVLDCGMWHLTSKLPNHDGWEMSGIVPGTTLTISTVKTKEGNQAILTVKREQDGKTYYNNIQLSTNDGITTARKLYELTTGMKLKSFKRE